MHQSSPICPVLPRRFKSRCVEDDYLGISSHLGYASLMLGRWIFSSLSFSPCIFSCTTHFSYLTTVAIITWISLYIGLSLRPRFTFVTPTFLWLGASFHILSSYFWYSSRLVGLKIFVEFPRTFRRLDWSNIKHITRTSRPSFSSIQLCHRSHAVSTLRFSLPKANHTTPEPALHYHVPRTLPPLTTTHEANSTHKIPC
jgi:hypothetical protein